MLAAYFSLQVYLFNCQSEGMGGGGGGTCAHARVRACVCVCVCVELGGDGGEGTVFHIK